MNKLPLILLLTLLLSACQPVASSLAPASLQSIQGDMQGLAQSSATALPFGSPRALCTLGHLVLMANGPGGLLVFEHGSGGLRLVGRAITGNIGHDSLDRQWIHDYRGVATAVAGAGHHAFVLTRSHGYDVGRTTLIRYDVSNPSTPREDGMYVLKGSATGVVAEDDDTACVSRAWGGVYPSNDEGLLSIIDLREAGRARIVGNVTPTGFRGQFTAIAAMGGGELAVCAEDPGHHGTLYVADVSQGAHPTLLGSVPLPRAATDVTASADSAWVALGDAGVVQVDLHDGAHPTLRPVTRTSGPASALTRGPEGVLVLTPQGVDKVSGGTVVRHSIQPAGLAMAGDAVVVGDAARGLLFGKTLTPTVGATLALHVDGATPVVSLGSGGIAVGSRMLAVPGTVSDALEAAGGYVAASDKGLYWLRQGQVRQIASQPARRLWRDGDLLYVTLSSGLAVYRMGAAPEALSTVGFPLGERMAPAGLCVRDGLACIACGRDGVRLVDVRDPRHPRLAGHWYDTVRGRMSAVDVRMRAGQALVADLDNGVYVLDVKNPGAPELVALVHTPNAHALDLGPGGLVAVADGVYGVTVLDLNDPRHPRGAAWQRGQQIKCTAVAFQNGTLWVAENGWVRACRVSARSTAWQAPRLAGTLPLEMGIPTSLAVSDDGRLACLANDEGWNVVNIDLRDPARPAVASVAETGGFPHSVCLQGHHAFATSGDVCSIFDLSDTAHPVLLNWIPVVRGSQVVVSASTLCILTAVGIERWDVSNPRSPHRIGLTVGRFRLIGAGGGHLAAVDAGGWHLYDVASMRELGSLPGSFSAMALDGNTAVLAQGKQLAVVSLQPGAPQVRAQWTASDGIAALALSGGRVYVAGGSLTVLDLAGMRVLASVPAQPNEGTYGGGIPQFTGVAPFGSGLVAAVDHCWGLRVYRMGSSLTETGNVPTSGGDYTGVQASGDRIYVGNNWGGVSIVDASTLHRLGTTRRLTVPNKGSVGLVVSGTTLYLQGNTDRTLRLVDVANPATPRLLAEAPLPRAGQKGDTRRFGATFGQRQGQYLYTPGFCRIYDVSDPRRPRQVGECPEAGFQNSSCALMGHYALLTSEDGLKVVDVSDVAHPRLVGVAPGDYEGGYYFGRGIDVAGHLAYVVDRHQLDVVDVSDATHPRRVGSIEVSGLPTDVRVVGHVALVAAYFGGLHWVDVTHPEAPVCVDHFQQGVYQDAGGWDNLACYPCLDVARNRVYVPEYYSGLQVVEVGP